MDRETTVIKPCVCVEPGMCPYWNVHVCDVNIHKCQIRFGLRGSRVKAKIEAVKRERRRPPMKTPASPNESHAERLTRVKLDSQHVPVKYRTELVQQFGFCPVDCGLRKKWLRKVWKWVDGRNQEADAASKKTA